MKPFSTSSSKRVFVISGSRYDPIKMFFQFHKFIKGFTRLGHDVMEFNYAGALREICPVRSKTIALNWYKPKVDKILAGQVKSYQPDLVLVAFARGLDAATLRLVKQCAPKAPLIGFDGDPWPKLQKGRIETARALDILLATNDGQWLQDYRDEGVKACHFIPNACDPDIERRYAVDDKYKSNILWIGGLGHSADGSYKVREQIIRGLAQRGESRLYGCCGGEKIGGMDCVYAMSGAKIGVSINAYEGIRLCHSDRLIRLLSCGAFVLSNSFPDCNQLYRDGEHLRYFDSPEQFFELADWYLAHEDERVRIAEAGMKWVHQHFNCQKIANYIIELVETGNYNPTWAENC